MTTPKRASRKAPVATLNPQAKWLGQVDRSPELLQALKQRKDLQATLEFLSQENAEEATDNMLDEMAKLKVEQTQLLKRVALNLPGASEALDKSRGKYMVLEERVNHAEHLARVRLSAIDETQLAILQTDRVIERERRAIWTALWEKHEARLVQEAREAVHRAAVLRVLTGMVSPRALDDLTFWHQPVEDRPRMMALKSELEEMLA